MQPAYLPPRERLNSSQKAVFTVIQKGTDSPCTQKEHLSISSYAENTREQKGHQGRGEAEKMFGRFQRWVTQMCFCRPQLFSGATFTGCQSARRPPRSGAHNAASVNCSVGRDWSELIKATHTNTRTKEEEEKKHSRDYDTDAEGLSFGLKTEACEPTQRALNQPARFTLYYLFIALITAGGGASRLVFKTSQDTYFWSRFFDQRDFFSSLSSMKEETLNCWSDLNERKRCIKFTKPNYPDLGSLLCLILLIFHIQSPRRKVKRTADLRFKALTTI